MKINIIRGVLIVLLLGTFWLIFGFSSQDADKSKSVSMKVSEGIVNVIKGNESKENKIKLAESIEHTIRKLAHFSIYTVVGFLLMALTSTYKLKFLKQLQMYLLRHL